MERADVQLLIVELLRSIVVAVEYGLEEEAVLILQAALMVMSVAQEYDAYMDRQRRNYFIRPDLLMPEEGQWYHLKRNMRDASLVHLLRVDAPTFELILSYVNPDDVAWMAGWTDATRTERRPGPVNFLQADDCIAATLAYLSSNCNSKHLELIFGVGKTLMGNAIDNGLRLLTYALERMPDAALTFPDPAYMHVLSQAVKETYGDPPIPTNLFALVDGFRVQIDNYGATDLQTLWYHGACKYENAHNLVLLLMDGTIAWANVNQPGNTGDYAAATPLFNLLRERMPPGFSVGGDDAFSSRTTDSFMATKKYTPVGYVADASTRRKWERWQKSVRQGVEWGIHTLTSTWSRLRVPLSTNSRKRRVILETSIRLHNVIARRMDHRNQLKTVYLEGMLRASEMQMEMGQGN